MKSPNQILWMLLITQLIDEYTTMTIQKRSVNSAYDSYLSEQNENKPYPAAIEQFPLNKRTFNNDESFLNNEVSGLPKNFQAYSGVLPYPAPIEQTPYVPAEIVETRYQYSLGSAAPEKPYPAANTKPYAHSAETNPIQPGFNPGVKQPYPGLVEHRPYVPVVPERVIETSYEYNLGPAVPQKPYPAAEETKPYAPAIESKPEETYPAQPNLNNFNPGVKQPTVPVKLSPYPAPTEETKQYPAPLAPYAPAAPEKVIETSYEYNLGPAVPLNPYPAVETTKPYAPAVESKPEETYPTQLNFDSFNPGVKQPAGPVELSPYPTEVTKPYPAPLAPYAPAAPEKVIETSYEYNLGPAMPQNPYPVAETQSKQEETYPAHLNLESFNPGVKQPAIHFEETLSAYPGPTEDTKPYPGPVEQKLYVPATPEKVIETSYEYKLGPAVPQNIYPAAEASKPEGTYPGESSVESFNSAVATEETSPPNAGSTQETKPYPGPVEQKPYVPATPAQVIVTGYTYNINPAAERTKPYAPAVELRSEAVNPNLEIFNAGVKGFEFPEFKYPVVNGPATPQHSVTNYRFNISPVFQKTFTIPKITLPAVPIFTFGSLPNLNVQVSARLPHHEGSKPYPGAV